MLRTARRERKSLAEEENADLLLNQIARSLMSVAKMPAALEQAE
jgi:Mn-containing catalase